MTAPTPEQMRALAARNDYMSVMAIPRHEVMDAAAASASALRAFADQLEAGQRIAVSPGTEVPTTEEIREEIGWAEAGPWTEINEQVKAHVEARQNLFDKWLAVHDSAASDEVDRLHAVIENAPHDPSCWLVDPQSTWTKNERDCTCWKADAL